MDKVLYVAASGMQAQKLYIDVIANNLANVNTTGFKKSAINFQDLLYESIRDAGEPTEGAQNRPVPLQLGNGSRAVATNKSFAQGAITVTENPLDIAIQGDGFMMVRMPDGNAAYTRDGALKISSDGLIVTTDGYVVEPELTIPEDAQQIVIRADGQVEVLSFGETQFSQIGQLELARFINPAGLESMGHNLYRETAASGTPFSGIPGTEGLGSLAQGFLEASNVDVVEEMVAMIAAQRAYEINSKAIRTAEEMYDIENRLK
ncbi:MAG: flagellar basal-body rod protein FlgG [Calditrichia bacterium]|nr:flagellar basal-body rod protein FlgG [Calditrichota bacterium]MCB0267591.1 flagellar basal-body rod protein FlgG [Calditrichota bacterium]MCB0285610.1 flagellar basal-body rod protein FlgG [Calditrichota bacterium]MCB9067996.1 flagellar basal-body rod protein FlgG [Calditrichia bacterium]